MPVHPHACGEYTCAGNLTRGSFRFIPTRVGNTDTVLPVCAVIWVHPHACGEYVLISIDGSEYLGSSPRVWGIRPGSPILSARIWFIPTRVGNTPCHASVWHDASGSSPRVWGILSVCAILVFSAARFIPTRVGNTRHFLIQTKPVAVHPHACGEYQIFPALRAVGGRFIPTRVGNTLPRMVCNSVRTVHPHACGEYAVACGLSQPRRGSSPRVWGIQSAPKPGIMTRRFIPTRVGNTHPKRIKKSRPTVHPHACGEYGSSAGSNPGYYGSSPRVWGIRCHQRFPSWLHRFIPTRVGNTYNCGLFVTHCIRFIPTRVGNTLPKLQTPSLFQVHPHACGEYYNWGDTYKRLVGSSPRVWGIRFVGNRQTCSPRFIPTRVGNTNCVVTSPPYYGVHPHACGEYGG